MYPSKAADSYLRTQVQASTPLERVVLLYDHALRNLTRAADAMVRGDIPARRDALSATLGIVGELQAVLDMERGGDLARELDRLYSYVTERLLAAAAQRSVTPIDEARRVLETLRDGWATIARQNASAGSAA